MKIDKKLFLLCTCTLLLAGCGDQETVEPNEVSKDTTVQSTTIESSVEEVEIVEVEKDGDSEVSENEIGELTRLAVKKELKETQKSGPFKVTVEAIQKSQLKTNEDYIDILGGEDLAVITIKVHVENISEDTNSIYADQGTIVTNTKKQVDADMFLSDNVGGDFIGEVEKSGDIIFTFEDNAEDITGFKYIVGSGSDENWEIFGEDLTFEFEF